MKKIVTLFSILFFVCSIKVSGQHFNCYIANDHLVSPTQYELDVYIQSTDSDFSFRTFQSCIDFNPAFIDSTSNVTVTFVSGSTMLNNFSSGQITWSPPGYGFEATSNTGVTCPTGTVISSTPVKIGTYRLVSSIPFNCAPADPTMLIQGNPAPPGLPLKMAVTKWATINCSVGTSSAITSNGTYSQYPSTGYSNVINMRPVISSQPDSFTTCSAGLAHFSVVATGNSAISTNVTYQWFENGVAVVNGSSGGVSYSGAATATLTVTTPTASMNGHHFYCIVSQCNSDTTISAVLTVTDANDNNACTIDACNSVTGIISHTPVNTDDGNPCTTDACDVLTGVVTHTITNTDDHNACTTDGCDPILGVYHTMVNVNDSDACTADACNTTTGVVSHTTIPTNDHNACTTDGCDHVTGVYHNLVSITDNNACTIDACDTVSGNISHTSINSNDNNACTIDGCDIITGIFHTPVNINDSNVCTIDACDTVTGAISHTPLQVSAPTVTVTNNCGSSQLMATGFTGALLWSNGQSSPSINVTTSGQYSVTQSINGCQGPSANANAAPLTIPQVNLGNDTVVTSGFSFTLDAGNGFSSYLWSTNATTQTILVNSTGTYWVTVTAANSCSNSDSILVTINNAVQEMTVENSFILFPNPVLNNLFILSNSKEEIKSVTVFNVLSQVEKTDSYFSKNKSQAEINTSSLAPGVYFVSIISGNKNCVMKFIHD